MREHHPLCHDGRLLAPDLEGFVGEELLGPVTERGDTTVRRWREQVLDRDGRQCVRCGSSDNLHAHHIVPWADSPALRLVVENGESLCGECHGMEHPDLSPRLFEASR